MLHMQRQHSCHVHHCVKISSLEFGRAQTWHRISCDGKSLMEWAFSRIQLFLRVATSGRWYVDLVSTILLCADHIDSNSCWLNPTDLLTDHNCDSNMKRTGDFPRRLWMKLTQPAPKNRGDETTFNLSPTHIVCNYYSAHWPWLWRLLTICMVCQNTIPCYIFYTFTIYRPRQNGSHFAVDIFKCILCN